MPKRPQGQKTAALDEIELRPDAWKRFEDFVSAKVPTRSAIAPKAKPACSKATRPKAKNAARYTF